MQVTPSQRFSLRKYMHVPASLLGQMTKKIENEQCFAGAVAIKNKHGWHWIKGTRRCSRMPYGSFEMKKNVADSLFETIIELQRRQGRLSIFRRFNSASRSGIAIDSQSLCSTAVMGANYRRTCGVRALHTPKICPQIRLHACKFNKSLLKRQHTAIYHY